MLKWHIPHAPIPLHRLNFTLSSPAPLPLLNKYRRDIGEWGFWPVCNSCSLLLHPPHTLLLLQHGVSTGCRGLSTLCLEHCLPFCHHWLRVVSHLFLSSLLCLQFLPFLKYVFPEAPHTQLWSTVVCCGESFEGSWNHLCPAWDSTVLFALRPPLHPSVLSPCLSHPTQPPPAQDTAVSSRQYNMQGRDLSAFLISLLCLSWSLSQGKEMKGRKVEAVEVSKSTGIGLFWSSQLSPDHVYGLTLSVTKLCSQRT